MQLLLQGSHQLNCYLNCMLTRVLLLLCRSHLRRLFQEVHCCTLRALVVCHPQGPAAVKHMHSSRLHR
jgi:hypothetical protein